MGAAWTSLWVTICVRAATCAYRSRGPQNFFCLLRYIALILFICVMIKELVNVGVVLFLLARRKGKVPPKLRRSSYLLVVIAPVGISRSCKTM